MPVYSNNENLVGQYCYALNDHIVVVPAKENISPKPQDPSILKNLLGAPGWDIKSAKVIFKTVYNNRNTGYWHNKGVYIILDSKTNYLVVEEGLKNCTTPK